MYTGKVDHRFSDSVSLTGFYLYNKSDEPCANYWEPGLSGENRFADPGDYLLKRRVHVLALNNTWLPSSNTVVTLRYGMTDFADNATQSIEFDPATLGFSQTYLDQMQLRKFPQIRVTDYDSADYTRMMGAIDPTDRTYYSWGANGAVSKLVGRHTFKGGADFRFIGLDFQSFSDASGDFRFDRFFTSSNPLANNAGNGNGFASMLLGFPSGQPGQESTFSRSNPLEVYTRYYGLYAQDDFRINSKLTVNYGVRMEHEDGLREKNDSLAVAFDRTLNPGGALGNVVVNGQPVRGGLVYAGQNGANDYQGDPPAVKFSPRLGLVYSFSPRTVMRAGYGVYWAPWNYRGQHHQLRSGRLQPGDAAHPGPLHPDGLRSTIRTRTACSSRSATSAAPSPTSAAPWSSSIRTRERHTCSSTRSTSTASCRATSPSASSTPARPAATSAGRQQRRGVNINQVPVEYLSLGAALTEQVANPFFGLPAGQGFAVTSPTVSRAQLLRPFPQFANITMRQSSLARTIPRGDPQVREAREQRLGRAHQLHLQPPERRPVGRDQLLLAQRRQRAGRLQHGGGVRPQHPRRAAQGRAVADHRAAVRRGQALAQLGDRQPDPRRLDRLVDHLVRERLPGHAAHADQRPGLDLRADAVGQRRRRRPGDRRRPQGAHRRQLAHLRRLRQPRHQRAGHAGPRDENTRTPHRNNWDFVATKDVRFGGSVRGQFRLEVLNITDTVKCAARSRRWVRRTSARSACSRASCA